MPFIQNRSQLLQSAKEYDDQATYAALLYDVLDDLSRAVFKYTADTRQEGVAHATRLLRSALDQAYHLSSIVQLYGNAKRLEAASASEQMAVLRPASGEGSAPPPVSHHRTAPELQARYQVVALPVHHEAPGSASPRAPSPSPPPPPLGPITVPLVRALWAASSPTWGPCGSRGYVATLTFPPEASTVTHYVVVRAVEYRRRDILE